MLAHKQAAISSRAAASKRAGIAVARPARAQPSRLVARAEAVTVALDVNDDTFDKLVLESKIPVLVDFWAPWCGPCRMISPLIDELAAEYAGKFTMVKINTDEAPQTASNFGVRSIPTIIIFKNGASQETIIGAVAKQSLVQTIEKFL